MGSSPRPHAETALAWRSRLAQFVCLTNELRPVYNVLRLNALPAAVLRELVTRCNATATDAAEAGILPELTSDGRFLSRFLVRNCDSWQTSPARTRWEAPSGSLPGAPSDAAVEPTLLKLGSGSRVDSVPRWLWDPELHPPFHVLMNHGVSVRPLPGRELELSKHPLFAQNQSSTKATFGAKRPRWRRGTLDTELDHSLGDAVHYLPGMLWVEPELWVFKKNLVTEFHYDYDPRNVVFQIRGSRRFQFLPPRSGMLEYTSMEKPLGVYYGTRWGSSVAGEDKELGAVVDLHPGEILLVPNGWPHRVTVTKDSMGVAVRSYTQCQALSLWLGQRLCTLSTALEMTRMCFDDENFREYGAYEAMEAVVS
eukprot:gnl/TRDRNA2_/TRDRNA2_80817_c0_seq1.p1 gnl/TRDRNA2_/TRDRNA2_80817_c0~~gnl/TRDRNA2_/TRDRNA2_80817_c0_seq1.p1  ORF type:complete len:367 (-),score=50.81 gnl/TRDRNA2_/TRDRNA2_80817_c0_seq1:69-1169(-)